MSLKALHICFIILSIFLAFGFGWWAVHDYLAVKNAVNLWMGIGSFFGGVVLAGYLVWFLSKMKRVGEP